MGEPKLMKPKVTKPKVTKPKVTKPDRVHDCFCQLPLRLSNGEESAA